MPSNQAPRPLTRPKTKGGSSTFVAASSSVLRAGSALTLFATVFLGLSLLFSLRSADQVASAGRKIEGYVAGSLHRGSGSRRGGCQATQLPGWISLSSATPHKLPTWETFDVRCPTSHILSSLVSATSALQEANAPEGSLDYLSNRTVLLITDEEPTQSRLKTLCDMMGGTSARVDVGHPWGGALQSQNVAAGGDMGTYCYLASKDLLIHHFPHHGVVDETISVEGRLASLLPQLTSSWASSPSPPLPSLPARRQRRSPDLTIWGSYSSDLATWTRVDVVPKQGGVSSLSAVAARQRQNQWRKRNLEVLQSLKKGLSGGGGKIMWISPGYGDATGSPAAGQDTLSLASLASTSQLSAAQESTVSANIAGSDGLLSTVPYSLRLPTPGPTSWFAGQVPWRRISEGLEALIGTDAGIATSARSAEIEAALWGETILGSLGLVA